MALDALRFAVDDTARWLLWGLLLLWAGSTAQNVIFHTSAATLAALSGQQLRGSHA